MTPEQKQRIKQIEAAQVKRRESLAFHQSEYPGLPSPDYISEIDFLLSLVKSQECAWCQNAIETAHVSNDVRFCSVGCQTQYEHEPRVTTAAQREQKPTLKEHLADVPAMIAALKTREDETMELQVKLSNAATSMRSACVEKVKALRDEWNAEAQDPRADLKNLIGVRARAKVDAANEAITELESLSIEQPKE